MKIKNKKQFGKRNGKLWQKRIYMVYERKILKHKCMTSQIQNSFKIRNLKQYKYILTYYPL